MPANPAHSDPAPARSGTADSVLSAMIAGAWRFAIVSIGAFGLWAFWGRWFYTHVGEAGLYAATALVFLGLAGALLYPLIDGPRRASRFYRVFVPAFLGYAVVWCAMWFVLGAGPGEWLGSLVGSILFALLCGGMLGNLRPVIGASVVLFVTHTAGYFLGAFAMGWLMGWREGVQSREILGVLAKLSWGLFYGLGFGAGLGYTFRVCQRGSKSPVEL